MRKRSLPPLGWFTAFESAARLLSFTAAAEELGLTQSAVSQQIRSLETRLGYSLFVRKHRAIALTDEARRLLPDVSEGIGMLRHASDSLNSAPSATVLTVEVSSSVARWFLVPHVQEFRERHSALQLRIDTAVWPDEFVSSKADVRVRFSPATDLSANSRPLGDNRMALVASPDLLPGRGRRPCSWEDIRQLPLIQAVGTADTWGRFAEALGYGEDKSVDMHVDSHGLSVDLARTGTGMALTSALISAPSLADGSLVLVHPQLLPASDGYFVDLADGGNRVIARRFVAWLRQRVRDSAKRARLRSR